MPARAAVRQLRPAMTRSAGFLMNAGAAARLSASRDAGGEAQSSTGNQLYGVASGHGAGIILFGGSARRGSASRGGRAADGRASVFLDEI